MILPSRDEFVRLAADHDVVPVAREVYADLATPISAFMALAEGAEHAFLLESVVGRRAAGPLQLPGRGRPRGHHRPRPRGRRRERRRHRRVRRRPAARRRPRAGGRHASRACRGCRCFVGGAVGYVGYETAYELRAGPAPRRRRARRAGLHASCSPTSSSPSTTRAASCRSSRRCVRAARPRSPTTRRCGASTATCKRIDEGPRGAELGRVRRRGAGADGGAHDARASSSARWSAPRSTSRRATSSRSCSRSATRRPYEGDGLDLYRVLRAVNPSRRTCSTCAPAT